jgi:hypothetical protein
VRDLADNPIWLLLGLGLAGQFVSLWVLTQHDGRLSSLETQKRKAQADDWDEETTVYSVKGASELNRMPRSIRLRWWRDRQVARLKMWIVRLLWWRSK